MGRAIPAEPAWRLGLDLGSTAAKAVLLDPDGTPRWRGCVQTRMDPAAAARELIVRARAECPRSDAPWRSLATGYGRALAPVDSRLTEITCHAAGARHWLPGARGVIDVGGQDAKAIRLAPDGRVDDFVMNDRCAAGTGRFLEIMAERFGRDMGFVGGLEPPPPGADVDINATCTVFAESELVGWAARGKPAGELLAAAVRAAARRIGALARKLDMESPVCFTGGAARLGSLRRALEEELGLALADVAEPQFAGALGASLLA